jgi:hypothetical protein
MFTVIQHGAGISLKVTYHSETLYTKNIVLAISRMVQERSFDETKMGNGKARKCLKWREREVELAPCNHSWYIIFIISVGGAQSGGGS